MKVISVAANPLYLFSPIFVWNCVNHTAYTAMVLESLALIESLALVLLRSIQKYVLVHRTAPLEDQNRELYCSCLSVAHGSYGVESFLSFRMYLV